MKNDAYMLSKYPSIEVNGFGLEDDNPVIIKSRVHGLFACFYCILYGLYICEVEKFKAYVLLGSDHLYHDIKYGPNIFEYFYDQPDFEYTDKQSNYRTIVVLNPGVFIRWCNISMVERRMSHYLIKKYFVLNLDIKSAIDSIHSSFRDFRTLAVHYRGRDKAEETPIPHFSEFETVIDNLFAKNLIDRMFFSTDELHLRNYVKEKYGDLAISYDLEGDYNHITKENRTGLHFELKSPYLHAKDALIECYLLSRSDLYLSSHKSSMSLFTTFIEPNIPHIIIEA